ncbi:hypothetical protein ALUC_40852A [Aspergillus luchuensis]|nr:hypothetical protein ALUC_40852A [Aspergillus luchuensis]
MVVSPCRAEEDLARPSGKSKASWPVEGMGHREFRCINAAVKISRYAVKESSSSHRNQSGERHPFYPLQSFSFPSLFPPPSLQFPIGFPPPFPIPPSSDASVSPRGDEAISFVIDRSNLIWYSLLFFFPLSPPSVNLPVLPFVS